MENWSQANRNDRKNQLLKDHIRLTESITRHNMALWCIGASLAWLPSIHASGWLQLKAGSGAPCRATNRSTCDPEAALYKRTTESGMQPGLHFVQQTQRMCGGASKKIDCQMGGPCRGFWLYKKPMRSSEHWRLSAIAANLYTCVFAVWQTHIFVVVIFCLAHLWHEDVLMSPYNEVSWVGAYINILFRLRSNCCVAGSHLAPKQKQKKNMKAKKYIQKSICTNVRVYVIKTKSVFCATF